MSEIQPEFDVSPDWVARLANSMLQGTTAMMAVTVCQLSDGSPDVVAKPGSRVTSRTKLILSGSKIATACCLITGTRPTWMDEDEFAALRETHEPLYDPVRRVFTTPTEETYGFRSSVLYSPGAADQIQDLAHRYSDSAVRTQSYLRSFPEERARVLGTEIGYIVDVCDLPEAAERYRNYKSPNDLTQVLSVKSKVMVTEPGLIGTRIPKLQNQFQNTHHRMHISESTILETVQVLGAGVRPLDDTLDSLWSNRSALRAAWSRTRRAWRTASTYLDKYGFLGKAKDYTLIPMVVTLAEFPEAAETDTLFRCWLLTQRDIRYRTSNSQNLNDDVQTILDAKTAREAVGTIMKAGSAIPFSAADFRDRNQKTSTVIDQIFYTLILRNGAMDWGPRQPRLVASDLHLHHTIPAKWCKQMGMSKNEYDVWANFSYLRSRTNMSISDDAPRLYLQTVAPELTEKQFWDHTKLVDMSDNPVLIRKLLTHRSHILAAAFNEYLFDRK